MRKLSWPAILLLHFIVSTAAAAKLSDSMTGAKDEATAERPADKPATTRDLMQTESPPQKARQNRSERKRQEKRTEGGSTIATGKFQIEVVKPYTTYTVKVDPSDASDPVSNDDHAEVGVRFTYVKLRRKKIGWGLGAGYFEYGGGSVSGTLRADALASYSFSSRLYLLFGAHIQKFLNSETAQIIDLGLGPQIALGYQFTRKFGIKLGYYYTVFNEKQLEVLGQTVKINTTLNSPEASVYFSF